RLRHVPPHGAAVAVRAGDVGDGPSLHHRLGHAALLRAVPDRRVAGAALVVGVEPARALADAPDVLDHADAAAEVAHVHGVGLALLGDAVPEAPHLHHAVHVDAVVLPVD